MKLNILNKESLALAYYENKDYIVPFAAIGISFLLFLVFILPQALSFPSKKQAVDVENEKLNRIKETEKIVLSTDAELLDSQLEIVGSALPPNKSFEAILNGISTAGALSGVQVENYQFQNVDLPGLDSSRYPKLEFKITIIGDARETVNFIKELYKTFPISEVTKISSDTTTSEVNINFYYKPFPSAQGEDRSQLKSTTLEQKKTMDEITKWNNSDLGSSIDIQLEASDSGEIRTSPF